MMCLWMKEGPWAESGSEPTLLFHSIDVFWCDQFFAIFNTFEDVICVKVSISHTCSYHNNISMLFPLHYFQFIIPTLSILHRVPFFSFSSSYLLTHYSFSLSVIFIICEWRTVQRSQWRFWQSDTGENILTAYKLSLIHILHLLIALHLSINFFT